MNSISSPSSTSSDSYNANALLNRFDLTYSPTPDPHDRDSPHWSSRATEGGMSRPEGVRRTDNTGPGRAILDSLRQNDHSLDDEDGADDAMEESLDRDDLSSLDSFGPSVDFDWDERGSDTTTNPHHMGNRLSRQDHQQPNSNTSGETIDLTGSPSPAPPSPRIAMPTTRSDVQPSSASRKRTRSEANLSTTDSEGTRPGPSNKRQRRTATANPLLSPLPGTVPRSTNPTRPGPRRRSRRGSTTTLSSLDSNPTEPDNDPVVHPSHLRTRIRPSATSRATAQQDPPRTIEQIDLCDDDAADNDRRLLERQRADQIAAQSASTSASNDPNGNTSSSTSKPSALTSTSTTPTSKPTHPTKLTTLTCTVCLDPPTDLTATACGHLFCRSCLLDWLVSAEREANRRPNCPACRKSLVWMDGEGAMRGGGRKKSDVVGLRFLRGRGVGVGA